MSMVTLLSGGLDSCLMSVLIKESGVKQIPLFINYGQINQERESQSAMLHAQKFGLPRLTKIDMPGFGCIVNSGLTDPNLHIVDDAFLPGRNLLLLTLAASVAVKNNCDAVAMGLLREDTVIFPDQTDDFIISAENAIEKAMGRRIEVVTPLRAFHKRDVIQLAKDKSIESYYSCHKGEEEPCGECISCKEFAI